MKNLWIVLMVLLFASSAFAGDVTYKADRYGNYIIHKWECTTTDGTVDTDSTQRDWSRREIAGIVVGAWVDNLSAESPDSSWSLYLRDNVMGSGATGWDWLFGKFSGSNTVDGTDRTATANYRVPIDTDTLLPPLIPGLRLVPYATGLGAGTRSFRLYLVTKN